MTLFGLYDLAFCAGPWLRGLVYGLFGLLSALPLCDPPAACGLPCGVRYMSLSFPVY